MLKSPHIYKKHRVQYEIRTHSRLMQVSLSPNLGSQNQPQSEVFAVALPKVKQITGTTSDVFLEYIQRNLPEGVHMSVYQVGE